jgi:DNA-3-methyladenine glycosylase I
MVPPLRASGISRRRVPLRKLVAPEDIADAQVREAFGQTGRCEWAQRHDGLTKYHDEIWGERPSDDRDFFERLMLEVFHAGLSWTLIWNKHEGIRRAYDDFDIEKVAAYGPRDIDRLMHEPDVIHSEKKIVAAIANAQRIQEIQDREESFESFLVGLPNSEEAKAKVLSNTFSFVGPGTARGYLAATGLEVPPHHPYCFKADNPAWSMV